jgi:Na+-transporting methylmalonyl-CoA/oxaloacetate decarboxylase gamma subunit
MNEDLIIGLRIGLIGLGVTFLALGLLSLVMQGLLALFPAGTAKKDVPVAPVHVTAGGDEEEYERLAAALAVGICQLEREGALMTKSPSLGKLLEKG